MCIFASHWVILNLGLCQTLWALLKMTSVPFTCGSCAALYSNAYGLLCWITRIDWFPLQKTSLKCKNNTGHPDLCACAWRPQILIWSVRALSPEQSGEVVALMSQLRLKLAWKSWGQCTLGTELDTMTFSSREWLQHCNRHQGLVVVYLYSVMLCPAGHIKVHEIMMKQRGN